MIKALEMDINHDLTVKQVLDICGFLPKDMVAMFGNLGELVNKTMQGSRIDLTEPKWNRNGYQAITLKTEDVVLADLTTINMKKAGDVNCYYLLYVNVAPPFRGQNISSRLLGRFAEFLDERQAFGFLANIIPAENMANKIYGRAGWVSLETALGESYCAKLREAFDSADEKIDLSKHLVFVPAAHKQLTTEVRQSLGQSYFQLMSKKAVIEARHNEALVAATIAGFKDAIATLLDFFAENIECDLVTPFMRYAFTRVITKYIAFRREIARLVGFTGGESLLQIEVPDAIGRLPIQSYPPPELGELESRMDGDRRLWMKLPREIQESPARGIESLPNYYRPSLEFWLKENKKEPTSEITISEMLNLGYDPSRLKEIVIDGEAYIFERLGHGGLFAFEVKKKVLTVLKKHEPFYTSNTRIFVNQPRLIITDSDNIYVLRRKVKGIHWDEAIDLIERYGEIFKFVVRAIRQTVAEARIKIKNIVGDDGDKITFFVPWDLETNQPVLGADVNYLGNIWVA